MDQPGNNEPPKKKHPNWGGKRPGSGAPKGNLNAWRHGRKSRYNQQLAEFLNQVPAARDAMLTLSKRRQKKDAQAQSAAADLMSEIFRRIGEAIVNPSNNHLENNQEFLALINRLQALFNEFSAQQSSEAGK